MQPTPTSPLPGGNVRRLRSGITIFHATVLLSLFGLAACRDPKVTAYRVPKEAAAELPVSSPAHAGADVAANTSAMPPLAPAGTPAAPGAAPIDPHALQTAATLELNWTAPTTWQSKPASMMRKATYTITGDAGATAELAVTAFPGDVGGDIANVNRWRGQVGLNPVSDAEAAAAIERFESNGLKLGVVDLVDRSAPNATHLLGAMVPYDGSTWFFKLVGPDAVVAAQKAAFVEFLKTVKPVTAAKP